MSCRFNKTPANIVCSISTVVGVRERTVGCQVIGQVGIHQASGRIAGIKGTTDLGIGFKQTHAGPLLDDVGRLVGSDMEVMRRRLVSRVFESIG